VANLLTRASAALDRGVVRATAATRFGVDRMVDAYVDVYTALVSAARATGTA